MPSRIEHAAVLPRPARAPGRSLAAVATIAGVRDLPAEWATLPVLGVTHDSRSIRLGDLYAALPGSHTHGARFTIAAARAGAVAVLTDETGAAIAASAGLPVLVTPSPRSVLGRVAGLVYGDPAQSLIMIGITGTSGKTTTSYLVEAGLRAGGHRTGLVGTVETRIAGDALHSGLTTPESTDLHALLALMHERGVTATAMEVSSHALAYGRVDGITFDVAVFTNLSQDHLDFHRDMADYFATKRQLFTPERARVGVVNVDDAHGRVLAEDPLIPIVTVSPSGSRPADWSAADVERTPDGSTFLAIGPGGQRAELAVNIPGRFNVGNATLALATLVTAGVDREMAAAGIAAHRDVPGRMERVDAGQPFLAVVDYAHKPDSVAQVLAALREVIDGRLIAVLGCGGDRDPDKRPLMGEAAARIADLVIITDDNPRSEDPAAIRAAALAGTQLVAANDRAEMTEIGDRRAAIMHAVGLARAGDAVAILGKGHEAGQERAGSVVPFDDREELRRAIEGVLG